MESRPANGGCWFLLDGGIEEQRDVMETGWVRGTCGLAGQRSHKLKPLNK